MSALGVVHIVAASLVPVAGLVAAYRAGTPRGRWAAWCSGAAAVVALVAGAARQRAWEPGYRRAVYMASRSAGEWLDRKAHLGFAACCLAIAAALVALDADAPPWLTRLVNALAVALALAAVVLLAYVHARVPTATLAMP